MKSLGKILKERRISLNKNQLEFSEMLGVCFTTYNRLESDRTYKPSFKTVKVVAKYLGITEEEVRELL